MGWTFGKIAQADTYGGEKEFVKDLFEHGGNQVVQMSKVGSEWYLAIKDPLNNVFGAVCLTKREKGEFGWKTIHEESLPYYFNAPVLLMKKLSSTTNKYAIKWRETCLEVTIEKKKQRNATAMIQEGDVFNVTGLFGEYQGITMETLKCVDLASRKFHCPEVGIIFQLKKKQVEEIVKHKIWSVA